MTSALRVERMAGCGAQNDFEACARIHREAIPDGFLATLGGRFLALLYRTLAGSRRSFLFVARRDGEILGFICGSEDTGAVYREFAWKAGLGVVPLLLPGLLSPTRILRVIETILYPARQHYGELPDAEILNFCVSTRSQGAGVGRRLFATLVDEFRARGVTRIRIVTGVTQKTAQTFYERAGAKLAGETAVHRDSPELVYVFNVGAPESAPAAQA